MAMEGQFQYLKAYSMAIDGRCNSKEVDQHHTAEGPMEGPFFVLVYENF
jgi:hypothetical protein